MAGKQLNVGVIGYGFSAKIFHIPFIQHTPGLALHSILQRTPGSASSGGASAPADHPSAAHHRDLDAFLADAALDVVVITTPPETHYPMAAAALRAGRHVLVEKPFTPTSREADDLARLAAEAGKVLTVYQNRRWDADFATARRLVGGDASRADNDGPLGRILEVDTHFERYRPSPKERGGSGEWKDTLGMDAGGGQVYDLGTHLIDQAYVLFGGRLPRSVFAKFANQRAGVGYSADPSAAGTPASDPDAVLAHLYYASGAVVNVRISVMAAEVRQARFWIRGARGSWAKRGLDPQEAQLIAGEIGVADPRFGRDPGPEWHGRLTTASVDGEADLVERQLPNDEPPPTYLEFYRLFAAACRGEGPNPVPATEAADVLRVIEAVRRSAEGAGEVFL